MKRLACALVAIVLLTGCGGGGAGSPSPAIPQTPRVPLQTVTLRMIFAAGNSTANTQARNPKFVSPSTRGVLAQVYAHGSSTLAGVSATDVSPGSVACGGSTSSSRTCTVTVPAPVGADDFSFTTYDAAPAAGGVGGSFGPSAHALGQGSVQNQTILAGVANTLTIYISGIIATIGEQTTYASLPADKSPHTFAFVINPSDFDNNTITAGSNDPYANPIAVSLSESGGSGHASLLLNGKNAGTSAQLLHSTDALQLQYDGGGSAGYSMRVSLSASGAPMQNVTVSPLYVSSASAYYSGGAIAFNASAQTASLDITEANAPASITYAAAAQSSCSGVLTASTPSGTGSSASATVTAGSTPGSCSVTISDSLGTSLSIPVSLATSGGGLTIPGQVVSFAVPGGSQPIGITFGSDGNLWFTAQVPNVIGKITPTGTITTFPLSLAATYITSGPDGNLWFTESDVPPGAIGRITPSGIVTYFPVQAGGGSPFGITTAADGNLWFTECPGAVGVITTGGQITYYSTGIGTCPTGIVAGPDRNLWFADERAGAIGRITPQGAVTAFPTGLAPFGIAVGSDGRLWFTSGSTNKIGAITTAGVISQYSLPTSTTTYGIAAGADGNLWVTAANNTIYRVTTTGSVTAYAVPSATTGLTDIAVGADGRLWFDEFNGNIGVLTP